MDTVLAFIKEYELLSGALGLLFITALGWLLRTARSQPSVQQDQQVGDGGTGYQAGGNITIQERKDV